jgi:biopolymer transport protein ExbD
MRTSAIARLIPRRRRARIEIIPLIDVIFFLLATFVLFTLSLDRIKLLDIELPEATDKPSELPPGLTLRVADAGTVYWDRDPITVAELPLRLADFKRSETDPKIMITSEPGVTLGEALAVLDEVRLVEGIKVTFDTRPASPRPE